MSRKTMSFLMIIVLFTMLAFGGCGGGGGDGNSKGNFDVDKPVPIVPVLNSGTVSRTSDSNATVNFTSNVPGMHYFQLNGSAPTAASLSAAGTNGSAMLAGNHTINFTTLTAGAHSVYIAAINTVGNVSNLLTITIPAYTAAKPPDPLDLPDSPGPNVLQGFFIDGRVEDLAYICSPSGTKGNTSWSGLFFYAPGDSIVFSVGNISLPPVAATRAMSPFSYYPGGKTDDTDVLNMVRFLMSAGEVKADGSIAIDSNPFGGKTGTYSTELFNELVTDGLIKWNAAQAKTHFEATLLVEYTRDSGDWFGIWESNSGGDSGYWIINISATGVITGNTDRYGIVGETLSGSVNANGEVTVTAAGGDAWNGKIDLATLRINGTYGLSPTGTFEGYKEELACG